MDAQTLDLLKLLGSTLALNMVQKHVIKRLPNDMIPYIGTVLSTVLAPAFGVQPEVGTAVGLGAVGIHQAAKIPVKKLTGTSI